MSRSFRIFVGTTNNNTAMNVFVYVDYREDKDTGEIEFSTPEVYATKEAAEQRYANSVCEIQEEIDEDEPFEELRDDGDFFILNSDWRYICIYYKEVEVK